MQNPLLDQESTEWTTRFLAPHRGNLKDLFSLLSAVTLLHYPALQSAVEETICDVCLRGMQAMRIVANRVCRKDAGGVFGPVRDRHGDAPVYGR